jgi:dimethylargininase
VIALVRSVPSTFARALVARPPAVPIDVARARAQHAAYVEALRSLGFEVVEIPADDSLPDCVFIEDTAVVARGAALLARSGAESRRGETAAVAPALRACMARMAFPQKKRSRVPAPAARSRLAARGELHRMESPATLDGGDCLLLGDALYAGLSARTNAAGVARLAEVFGPRGIDVRAVAMPPGALHLKSVCSSLGDDVVLVAAGTLPAGTFPGARVLPVPAAEAHAANAVACAGAAIMAPGCPRTRDLVEAAGFRAVPVDTSELAKADGALTCLSILIY